MDNRLKERLTGAAILVALIVLVVPELLRGHGGESVPTDAPKSAATGSAALHSYTVDLSSPGSGPARPGTVQHMTSSRAAPLAGASTAGTVSLSTPRAVRAPAPAPRTVPAVTRAAPIARTGPGEQAGVSRKLAPPSSSAPAASAASKSARGRWVVQLGVFSIHADALRLARRVRARGFTPQVSAADAHGHYWVRLTGRHPRAAAQTLERRLRAHGFKAILVSARD